MTLYLKYRPFDFETIVGQNFVKETLKQAIIKDKLVGAYLFCGPRGTGKTSSARVFAKAINCKNSQNGNPCLKCEICKGFDNENLVDIIEIDAASHTGVDNIRDIIEKAKFSPTICKYKVYIIDEVHMLSKGAFNALLKILEEPPTHLKFILATTEIQKIPETILSRCQRYDFKSFNDEDLKGLLLKIAEKENIKVDLESIDFILKEARGGARNAISLFEQLIYNDEINYKNILNNYGIPKKDILENFYTKILNSDKTILNDLDDIFLKYNPTLFLKELLFFIKDKMLENIENNQVLNKNIFILEILEETYIKFKNTFDIKTTFLVGLIKTLGLYNLEELKNIPIKLEKKVEHKKLEKNIDIQETITKDDLLDVFGDDEFLSEENENYDDNKDFDTYEPIKTEIKLESKIENPKNSLFNKDLFIENIKSNGGKGALTMSLRGSEISINGNDLIILTKTKISQKQLSDNDSILKMKNSLDLMGFSNINIVLK